MTHQLGILEQIRQTVASILHLPLSSIGLYAERKTPRNQYALTVRAPICEFEATLHRLEFVRNLVSSLKRRKYEAPTEVSVASWVWYPNGALFSTHQLHIALYVGPDEETTDVYAHWEPSWIRHPIRHYRAHEVDDSKGVELFREIISNEGVEYYEKPTDERFPSREEGR